VLEFLKTVLEAGGFRVGTASGAIAALEFHTGKSVDMLVTDIDMPDGNGLDLAEDLLARQPNLPVLFITGGAHFVETTVLQPEQTILQKPISARILISTVSRMLNCS
jgi:DNA-binding NtrC family response regulator